MPPQPFWSSDAEPSGEHTHTHDRRPCASGGLGRNIRGQGRVAFKRGYVEEALEKLSDAAKRFETLHRNQEAGRTLADIGQVCCKLGHVDEAADAYRKAIALLESIKVPNDVQRVQRMLSVLPTDDSEPCPEASTGEPTET